MKNITRNILMSLALCLALTSADAQFVNIPDANFRTWLNNNGFASCMNGNQMDTTCSAVVNATDVNCSGSFISNFTGISYFDNLYTLDCSYNQLISIPRLPASLIRLNCNDNQLNSLPVLPSALTYFSCYNNQLNVLPPLPPLIKDLTCFNNHFTALPVLPPSLEVLHCSSNQLTSLPTLPASLKLMYCGNNQLTSLPALPASLITLNCTRNLLTALPALSSSVTSLTCNSNDLTSLPSLPAGLTRIECYGNQLTTLPVLPSALTYFNCSINSITALPSLPTSLNFFYCSYNQLTSLPALPSGIRELYCNNNQLSSLPAFNDTMANLYIYNNPGLTCLPAIGGITGLFWWANTGITCLPNSISVGNAIPTIAGVPICLIPSAPTSITVSGGTAKVCPGDTRTYSTALVNGVTYNWIVPTGAVIYSGQGTRTVNVTYNSGFINNGLISVSKVQGCGVSTPKTLAINRNIPATPSAITGLTYGLCGATNKTYSVLQVTGMTYQWTLPSGASFVNGQGTNSITVNFTSTNFTGTVSVKAVNACGAGNARILTVLAKPTTPVSILGTATACANQQNVSYSTAAVASATSYNWTVPSGALITGGQGTTSIVMNYGTSGGTVRVRAMNGCGSGSYRNLAITINCREGAENFQPLQDVSVYPNPSKNYFTVSVSNSTQNRISSENNYSIVVRDVIGRIVFQYKALLQNKSFDFGAELSIGIYIAEVVQGNDKRIVRLIKSN